MTPGLSMRRSHRVRSIASSRSAPPTTAITLSEPDDLAASVSNSMTARVYVPSGNTAQVMMHPHMLFIGRGGFDMLPAMRDHGTNGEEAPIPQTRPRRVLLTDNQKCGAVHIR